jgi:4-oxalocrotonate tautomerase
MPVVRLSLREGRTEKQKRSVIRRVTQALAEETGAQPERVMGVLCEVPAHNWAAGGSTLAGEAATAAAGNR